MGYVFEWFLRDEEDFVGAIRQEIQREFSQEMQRIDFIGQIAEIEGRIAAMHVSFGELKASCHGSMRKPFMPDHEAKCKLDPSDLEKIRQEISFSLRQEIHEEISQSQVNLENKLKNSLQEINRRIQKLEERVGKQVESAPIVSAPVDLAPIQNAIQRLQVAQQQAGHRLGQIENSLNTFQPTVDPMDGKIRILQAQMEEQNRTLAALQKALMAQSQSYEALKSAFDEQERENAALKQMLSDQEGRLRKLEEKNSQQVPREISEVKKQAKSLHEARNVLRKETFPVPQVSPSSPAVKPWIKSFALSRATSPSAFFHGDGEHVKARLAQSIQDMDSLITYLETQAEIEEPACTSFKKNLRWCMEALEKLYGKFDFDGCDAEEISEEITGKFFKIISENLLDNVMIAIYRGGKGAGGYPEFLQNVNSYLSRHGIYTEEVVPGMMLEGDMLSHIEPPIFKQTSAASDHGKVDEVELLPYFMFYEDDDGNLDTLRKRGRVVCLKYGV